MSYDRLYHYTNFRGVHGILKSGNLWATRFDSLNDPSELRIAIDKLAEFWEEKIRQLVKSPEYTDADILHDINNLANVFIDNTAPYVLSFCSRSNSFDEGNGRLSQWRIYGRYCIVFNRKRLEAWFSSVKEKMFPHVVFAEHDAISYVDESDLTSEQNDIFRNFAHGMIEMAYFNDESDWNDAIEPFVKLGPFLKTPAYRDEEEYRFMVALNRHTSHTANGIVDFREFSDRPCPFIRMFDKSTLQEAIEKIIVGPQPEREHVASNLLFLAKAEEYGLDVEVSAVELR